MNAVILTKERIISQVQEVDAFYQAWKNLPEDQKEYDVYFDENNQNDRQAQMLSMPLINEFFSLVKLCSVSNDIIENRAAKLVLMVDAFTEVFFDWVEAKSQGDDTLPPDGGKPFVTAWNMVMENARILSLKRLESIEELQAQQGSNKQQIMKIYEFFDDDGTPRNDLYSQELAKPGSVVHDGPGGWNPFEVAEFRGVRAKWSDRASKDFSAYTDLKKVNAENLNRPSVEIGGIDRSVWQDTSEAPETIQQLVHSDPPARIVDILNMKKQEIEAGMENSGFEYTGDIEHDRETWLLDYIVSQGWNHPDERVVSRHKTRNAQAAQNAAYAPVEPVARPPVETYDQIEDMEFRVNLMSEDGHGPAVITQALLQAGENVTFQQVAGLVRSHSTEPQHNPDAAPSVVDAQEIEDPPKKEARGGRRKKAVNKKS